MTSEGVALVQGEWRYSDTRIVEVGFRAPDAEGQPTGGPLLSYDHAPHAGWADYDDSSWEVLDPATVSQRRGTGRICFNWYRIAITIPERIGGVPALGTTVVFETSIDDYAEVWVDGELPRELGQSGGSVVKGWNAENRLVVARNARPGQKIQLAVFGVNGPLSSPPTNFIWMRRARLDFYPTPPELRGPVAVEPHEVNVEVLKLDPRLDELLPANPKLFKLAEGFAFTEGPVWVPDGYLLFSDPNRNTIYRYASSGSSGSSGPSGRGDLSVFHEKSGYEGEDIDEYGQPGSNGLTLDLEGRLTVAEHGRHRISRRESDGGIAVLAESYGGKRLNSPNDLVYRSDGTLYFTDPPFGLPRFFEDPRKELDFSGVYRWKDGRLELEARELTGPNGLAFSPDESYLYVDNWDVDRKVVMCYEVMADGSLVNAVVFFDMTGAPGEEALDGLKVDERGNLYVSGPGGIWILSPQATHLGTIRTPKLPANFAWGGEDGKTLYLTARDRLYRMPLNVRGAGVRPWSAARKE